MERDDKRHQVELANTVYEATQDLVADELAPVELTGERYLREASLGVGGMGIVELCQDRLIGRDVARKVAHVGSSGAASRGRFLREARIQARLEHPAIVPVYDMGRDAAGVEYFTMRRISGTTLAQAIAAIRAGDEQVTRRFTRSRLLEAFRDVCLAIDYAHRQGVVHRDLKPANVMLGEFGEVYVLDWGVATLVPTESSTSAVREADVIVGTPGYMAPEQLIADRLIGRAADIYALGAILFELLTLERLHTGGNVSEIIRSTLDGADTRATVRAPTRDVPPELEEICRRATAQTESDRYASARALHDDVERFLDGDRNLELRRTLAARHAASAAEHAERALGGDATSLGERRAALREVARALALDPDDALARSTLSRMIAEPPTQLPTDVSTEIRAAIDTEARFAMRLGIVAFAALIILTLAGLVVGVRDWLGLMTVLVPITAAALWCLSGMKRRINHVEGLGVMGLGAIATVGSAGFYGPWIMVPAFAVANTMAFNFSFMRPYRRIVLLVGCLSVVIPMLLEWFGAFGASYAITPDAISISPGYSEFTIWRTRLAVLFVSLTAIAIPTIVMWRIDDNRDALRRRLVVQSWQLGQLMTD